MNNSDNSQFQSVYCKILKIQGFMDRFFTFLSRNKSVFSLKNRSRTGITDDFSSPAECSRVKMYKFYNRILNTLPFENVSSGDEVGY